MLRENPEGLRYSELTTRIANSDASFNINTIRSTIWNLDQQYSDKVYKPSRGLFRLVEFQEQATDQRSESLVRTPRTEVNEAAFYEPFADWLVNDTEDCTKAIPLGGNRFRDKWGTPDVIGKRESKRSDIIQSPIEIVSAEVKADTNHLVTAFGQACAYCLFSHKAYLVVPKSSPEDEIARLDSLCQVFGIGLVLFNVLDPKTPEFEIRVRPRKQEPDLFYANRYMKRIEGDMFA